MYPHPCTQLNANDEGIKKLQLEMLQTPKCDAGEYILLLVSSSDFIVLQTVCQEDRTAIKSGRDYLATTYDYFIYNN